MSSESNDLVVYTPSSLDFSRHITDLEAPLRSLNPESRIVSGDDMYAGGFYSLSYDRNGIDGVAYVSYLKAIDEKKPEERSLASRMIGRVFGDRAKKVDGCIGG